MRTVTSASAAVPSRLLACATLAVSVIAFVAVGNADGAARSWVSYLAPAGACRGADDALAPVADQVRAVTCLVNWARVQDDRARLVRRSALQRAAVLKGQRVAECRQFSHTPCGLAVTVGVSAAGYRYASFAENLFAGVWGDATARDVVAAWLQSPSHRANVLGPGFRHIGVAPVRAHALFDGSDAVVWTATFASPQ